MVGLGMRAIEYYIPAICNSEYPVELVAICDINHEKLNYFSDRFKCKKYTSFKKLINNESLDFIIAVTPHYLYKDLIKYASQKKINILKEKPFAINLEEAVYLMNLCQKSGIQVMTALHRRLNPMYASFFDLENKIGSAFFIESKYTFLKEDLEVGWRADKETSGGGCILDMGYHIIDLIIWYFGLPDKIHAEFSSSAKPHKYDVEDTASILFTYQNGLYGSIIISRYFAPKTEFIRVIGSGGVLEIDRNSVKCTTHHEKSIFSINSEQNNLYDDNPIDYFCEVLSGKSVNIGCPAYHLNHLSFVEACYQSRIEGRYISPIELLKKYGIETCN